MGSAIGRRLMFLMTARSIVVDMALRKVGMERFHFPQIGVTQYVPVLVSDSLLVLYFSSR